jgi:carbonic anhydrase
MDIFHGYKKFFEKYFKQKPELYEKLLHVQSPETLFLACCDSRIDPAILTSAEPGQIFVVRNIANYVPSYVSRSLESEAMTAIEFAVCNLKVKSIIVLGHQHCAGVEAIVCDTKKDALRNFPIVWQEQRERLRDEVKDTYTYANSGKFEKANLQLACHDLLTYPFIQERVAQGQLTVDGWYFYLETGVIERYDTTKRTFKSLETEHA